MYIKSAYYKKQFSRRVASIYLARKASEDQRKKDIFKKVAPTYKSKASDKEILWATAYEDKTHPNHPEAVKDYQKWAEQNTGDGLTQKMISKRASLGEALISRGKKLASKTWAGVKAIAKQGKGEMSDMLINTPKLLGSMATGKYDFSDKDQLKKDLKTIWGSAVYYGGITACVMTAGAATPLMTAGSTAAALGKSVATHAVIGSVSGNADFWGFLSAEAAETVAGITGNADNFKEAVGGLATTDLFDGVAGAVKAGMDFIASDSKEMSDEDKIMVEYLGRVNMAIGNTLKNAPKEEIEKIAKEAKII